MQLTSFVVSIFSVFICASFGNSESNIIALRVGNPIHSDIKSTNRLNYMGP